MDLQKMVNPSLYNESNSKYLYNGVNVPRVTEILSAMLHEDYLMGWANAMGLYKHTKYEVFLNTAADIGTAVHEAIEKYLGENISPDIDNYPQDIKFRISCAFNSFLSWWDIIKKTKYKIILQEYALVCKYFGGTLDMLIEINGKVYIVDFKTSNHSSYKHFLQLAAYRYMLEENGYKVDGCIILLLDKKTCKFTEYVLHFDQEEHLKFIDQCEECFLSLVYGYYNRGIVENMYKNIFG